MKVILKNGKICEITDHIHGIFEEGDGCSYHIPATDIIGEYNPKSVKVHKCDNSTVDFVTIPLSKYSELLNKSFIAEYILNSTIPKQNNIQLNIYLKFLDTLKENYKKFTQNNT